MKLSCVASDACRLAPGRDALRIWRPLSEPRELGRSSKSSRLSPPRKPAGAAMVLIPFAETKGTRRPGTKPRGTSKRKRRTKPPLRSRANPGNQKTPHILPNIRNQATLSSWAFPPSSPVYTNSIIKNQTSPDPSILSPKG